MKRDFMYNINERAFRDEFKRRNLRFATVSRELGYGENKLSAAIYDKRIHRAVANQLKLMYGIDPDSYIIKEDPPKPVEAPGQDGALSELTKSELLGLVYAAVKGAIVDALKETGLIGG